MKLNSTKFTGLTLHKTPISLQLNILKIIFPCKKKNNDFVNITVVNVSRFILLHILIKTKFMHGLA